MKFLYAFSFVIIFLFISCSDNPLVTKRDFVPPLYSWTIDTFDTYIGDILITDTNSYFAISGNNLIIYSDGIIKNYYFDSYCETLDGIDAENIVLGGARTYNQTASLPVMIKYNNGITSNLYVGSEPDIGYKFSRVRLIDNIFWGGTNKGEIVSVNGNTVNHYTLDTTYYIHDIIRDNSKVVYAFAGKELHDTNGVVNGSNVRLYSFINNNWNLVYNENISGIFNFYEGIADHMFCLKTGTSHEETYEYNAGNFTQILPENLTGVETYLSRGTSFSDILIFGGTSQEHNNGLYHWNGKNTSEEVFDVGFYEIITIKNWNNRYFTLLRIQPIVKSLLFKGKLKN